MEDFQAAASGRCLHCQTHILSGLQQSSIFITDGSSFCHQGKTRIDRLHRHRGFGRLRTGGGGRRRPPLPPRSETAAMDDAASWRALMDDVEKTEMDSVRETAVDGVGVAEIDGVGAMDGQVGGSRRRRILLRSVRLESGRGFVPGRETDRGLFTKITNQMGETRGVFRKICKTCWM
jgi:hypothetical protein